MPPASWATITRHRHKLTRHPDVLKAYQDFKSRLATKGQTLEDHMRATVLKGAMEPVLVPNQFPYWVADGIQHWVLWSPREPLSPATIRTAITAQRPVWARETSIADGSYSHSRRARVTEAFWFENPPAAKTVPGIWHVHVFLTR